MNKLLIMSCCHNENANSKMAWKKTLTPLSLVSKKH